MRITCENATAYDLQVLHTYLGSGIKVTAWPDASLSFKLKNTQKEQLESLCSLLEMLSLCAFFKPTDAGDENLL